MQWKAIPNFEDYEISDTGLIRQGVRPITLQPNGKGYLRFIKMRDRKVYRLFVHRLVASLYLPNPAHKPQVNHKDGNKTNNCVENLEWVTPSENRAHAFATGLQHTPHGEAACGAKLTEADVRYIKEHAKKHDKQFNYVQLGKVFNVHAQTIKNIVDGKKWKHVE